MELLESMMSVPDPFTPVAITAGVLTNIATDILKHHAQSLETTLAGRMLKWAGLIEPNFDERLRATLSQALSLYFESHPQYKLTGITAFFQDPDVGRQIGAFILDRQRIDEKQIQQALNRHLGQEAITGALIKKRNLDPDRIVPDFLACYRRVLNQHLTIPHVSILLEIVDQTDTLVNEIKASEARLKEFISELLERRLSPEVLRSAYQTSQRELATELVKEMDTAGLVQPDQALRTIQARLDSRPALFENGLCRGHPLRPTPEQYFVSHSFDANTLADWRQTLAEVLAHAAGATQPLQPYFAGDTLLGGFRLCSISEKLCTSRFSLFLLPPSQDRNVYLELGIAIGLGAPFFLIQHYEADIPPILASLGRYTKGGLFRRMRRELAEQIEEYDFGVVRFMVDPPPANVEAKYLIAAGGTIEDEDFEGSVMEAISNAYPHLEVVSLTEQLNTISQSSWALEQLVEAIQTTRFAIYRVDEDCSPTTFLALGLSISLNRPFLMVRRAGRSVPQDIQGIILYEFGSFVSLKADIVSKHQSLFNRYAQ